MKRDFLLLIFATYCMTFYAQSSSDKYKYHLIKNINNGKFNKATKIIDKVNDWTFNSEDNKAWLDLNQAVIFVNYIDSIGVEKNIYDSLLLYMNSESIFAADYYYDRDDYTSAIPFCELTTGIYFTMYGNQNLNYATSLNNLGYLYYSIRNYSKAEEYYQNALSIRKEILGTLHIDCADLLEKLGNLYKAISDLSKAENYYLEAMAIRKELLGIQNPEYALSLNNIGVFYVDIGHYEMAEDYLRKAVKIRKEIFGEMNSAYSISLNNLGVVYMHRGDYPKAEECYLQALKIKGEIFGKNHYEYAVSLNSLGLLYKTMADYNRAEKHLSQSLSIRKETLGERHPDYAISLGNMGSLYHDMGDYGKAEQYYLQVLSIRKETLGERHPDYAISLGNMGGLYYDMGDYRKAEQYYIQAFAIQKETLGERHPDYAISLRSMGDLYCNMGDYRKAEQYYLQVLSIQKEIFGNIHPDYAQTLNVLGLLYIEVGDFHKSEKYLLQSLSIRKEIFGDHHPDYITTFNNLGSLYHTLGDLPKAEKYLLQTIKIEKDILGDHHPNYANSLNEIGSLYETMGNYSKAEEYYLQSLSIRKEVLGDHHPDYAVSLNNLGYLYMVIDNHLKAYEYLQLSLTIINEVYGNHHILYAHLLNNLGSLFYHMGNYSKAEEYLSQSLSIQKEVLGDYHLDYAFPLNNLGCLYLDLGDFHKAEEYLLQALKIQKEILGKHHSDYALSIFNLGLLYYGVDDYSKAKEYFYICSNINKELFMRSTNHLISNQLEKYWTTIKSNFEWYYPQFSYRTYQTIPDSVSRFAYDNELFRKGLLLHSANALRRSILESNDTTLINQWNQLTRERQTISAMQEKDPTSPYLAEHEQRADSLEKVLTISSTAFRENRRQWNITCDSVRSVLSPTDVAIEYFAAPLNEDSTMYCALLLRHNSEHPELIPLFEEKQALALINTTNQNQTNLTYFYEVVDGDTIGNGAKLSQLVWNNILPHIKQGETVYFAPSGLLHQLAIEALPYDEDHTMADMFNLVRLSSTRELVLNKQTPPHTTATLYGGIQYNMSGDEILAESEQYQTSALLASRGIENDTLNRGTVSYLPGSKTEVENINRMLQQSNMQVQLFTSTAANEESFKSLSGTKQNILHIATHGFFWTDSTAQKKDYFSQRMLLSLDRNMPALPAIDPLNRCGLLFAGANTALTGHSADLPEGVQDGILTAKEISLLDLRGADLVVLSACETGKGEITGDGVFGLQRAFKQAGVQTIIMSLWPVSDNATQLLMTEFYRNWLGDNQTKGTMSKCEAFRKARTTVRSRFSEPCYWAGFVMLD